MVRLNLSSEADTLALYLRYTALVRAALGPAVMSLRQLGDASASSRCGWRCSSRVNATSASSRASGAPRQ